MIEFYCQKSEYEFTIVKEETDGQIPQVFDKTLQVEDLIYMRVSLNSSSLFVYVISEHLGWLVNCNLCHL